MTPDDAGGERVMTRNGDPMTRNGDPMARSPGGPVARARSPGYHSIVDATARYYLSEQTHGDPGNGDPGDAWIRSAHRATFHLHGIPLEVFVREVRHLVRSLQGKGEGR